MQKWRRGLWTESGITKGGNNIWDVWPWRSPLAYRDYRTAQEKSDQLNARYKPAQDSLGTLSCICTLQAIVLHPQVCLLTVLLFPLINESGMTLLLEYPNMNRDFSNFPLSCPSALGNMYMLSKAVNEIKLSPKLVCSSLWNNLWELLCLSVQKAAGAETEDASSKALWKCLLSLGGWRICFFWKKTTLFAVGKKKPHQF